MVIGGPAAVTCLLAWLWVEHPGCIPGSPVRFAATAPTRSLTASIPGYLGACGLLVQPPVLARASSRALQPAAWQLIPPLQDPNEALLIAMNALSQLQRVEGFADNVCALWRELAAAEILGFLAAELLDHRFDDRWAADLEQLLMREVHRLSIARGFYFCWLAVRDLASAYLRFPAARDRLPETLRRSFESKLSKSQTEAWTTRPFARHVRNPESAIAAVFSTVVTSLYGNYCAFRP